MAKRKKLNKRVVVILTIFGLLLAVFGIGVWISKLPKDPEPYARQAREALEKGDLKKAEIQLRTAAEVSREDDPNYFYEWAMLQEKFLEQPGLSHTELRERYSKRRQFLQIALRRDPSFLDAQKALTEIYWQNCVTFKSGWKKYIQEADALVKLAQKEGDQELIGLTIFKRGLAKSELAKETPGQYTAPALEDLEKAIELDPSQANRWRGLIQFYLVTKKTEEAEGVYKKGIEANPDDPILLLGYSSFLLSEKREQEAVDMIHLTISRASDNPAGYMRLAQYHLMKREPEKALEALESAKAVDDSQYGVYQGFADIYNRMGQPAKAAEAIRAGLQTIQQRLQETSEDKMSETVRRRLEGTRLELHYLVCDLLLDALPPPGQKVGEEMMAELQDSLEKITQANPEGPHRAKIAGRLAYRESNFDQALELLEKAHAGFKGRDIKVANLLISLYFRAGRPGDAEAIVAAQARRPQFRNNPSILMTQAGFAMTYRNYDKALELVERALVIAPDNEKAKQLKADLQIITGASDQLPENFEVTTESVRLLLERAQRLWVTGQEEKAVSFLERLHKKAPKEMPIISALFNMYAFKNDIDKCKVLIAEAREYYPDSELLKAQMQLLDEPDMERRLAFRLKMADEVSDPLQRAMEKALIYTLGGRKDEYLKQLLEAEKIDPKAPQVVTRLFQHAVLNKDWQRAQELQQRAAEANLDGVKGKLYNAQLLMAKEEILEAIRVLQEIRVERPDAKRIETLLGNCYLRIEEYKKAEEIFGAMVSRDPGFAMGVIGMAKATAGLGKMDEHGEWIEKAYRLAPQDEYVQEKHLIHQEEILAPTEELITKRVRRLEEDPSDMDNRIRLVRLYVRSKQYGKAEEVARSIWEHPRTNKLVAARLLVFFYADMGRYSEGIAILEQLLKQTDDRVGAYVLYGQFLSRYDSGQAKRAFQKAIDADPKSKDGYLAMAQFLMQGGKWKDATEVVRQIVNLEPDQRVYKKELARCLIESEQFDEVSGLLEKMIEADPSDIEAMVLKGILLMGQKQFAQSEQVFTNTIEMNPEAYSPLYYRSRCYRLMGEFDKALRDLQDARKLYNSVDIIKELAELSVMMGNRNEAALLYNEALSLMPHSQPNTVALLNLYYKEKRWPPMEKLLEEARMRFPKAASIPFLTGRMWTVRRQDNRAAVAFEETLGMNPNYAPAIELYLKALIRLGHHDGVAAVAGRYRDNPQFAPWILGLEALSLAKQNREAQADKNFMEAFRIATGQNLRAVVEMVREAYGLDTAIQKIAAWAPVTRPKDAEVYKLVGLLFLQRKDYAQAEKILLKALSLAQTDAQKAEVNRVLGSVYHEKGDYDKAEQAYLYTLKIVPSNTYVLNNLGYLYAEGMNQPNKALPYLERSITMMPMNGNVLDSYGWALAKVGRLREAEGYLVRSVEAMPSSPVNRFHLGWVYEKKGRRYDALGQYQEADTLIQSTPSESIRQELREALDRILAETKD